MGKTSQSYGDAGLGLGTIALHGTYDDNSIGRDKSLGCIRLTNEDIQQVFSFVPKGAEVRNTCQIESTPNLLGLLSQTSRLIPVSLPQHSESGGKGRFPLVRLKKQLKLTERILSEVSTAFRSYS